MNVYEKKCKQKYRHIDDSDERIDALMDRHRTIQMGVYK